MNIRLKSVPAYRIRNKQVGDWFFSDHTLYPKDPDITVHVLDSLSPDSQLAVAIHELIEAWLCRRDGVTDEAVTVFDQKYELERDNGMHGNDEPGHDPLSPYREQHIAAEHVERAVCQALDLKWSEHCNDVSPTEPLQSQTVPATDRR